MNLYVESSALVSALAEGNAKARNVIRRTLRGSTAFCSSLTLIETTRSIRRKKRERVLTSAEARSAERALAVFRKQIRVIEMEPAVAARAQRSFRVEPIRSLDAIQVATALLLDSEIGNVTVLSHDDRVRENARAYGLGLLPTVADWKKRAR